MEHDVDDVVVDVYRVDGDDDVADVAVDANVIDVVCVCVDDECCAVDTVVCVVVMYVWVSDIGVGFGVLCWCCVYVCE